MLVFLVLFTIVAVPYPIQITELLENLTLLYTSNPSTMSVTKTIVYCKYHCYVRYTFIVNVSDSERDTYMYVFSV
jgi:hypothetical protein